MYTLCSCGRRNVFLSFLQRAGYLLMTCGCESPGAENRQHSRRRSFCDNVQIDT